jgi:dynactin complex subunit
LDIALSNITQIALENKDELLLQAIVNLEKAKVIVQSECPYSLDEEVLKHMAVWNLEELYSG